MVRHVVTGIFVAGAFSVLWGCGTPGTPGSAGSAGEELGVAAELPRRPNVLFIAVDDLRPELGCYGAAAADSPCMDAFASTACVFEQHFVHAPSCGPSRYALLTGRSPHRSRGLQNNSLYGGKAQLDSGGDLDPQSFPELFRKSGYRTVCIGKISHTPDGRVYAYDGAGDGRPELPGAWDELATPFGPWKRGWGGFFAYEGGAHREDGTGTQDLFEFTAAGDRDLPDGLLAEAAAQKLHELKGRDEPFLLGVGFYKPHLPFVATAADRAAAEGLDVGAPESAGRWASPYAHGSGEFFRYDMPFEKRRGAGETLEAADAIDVRRAYAACVRYVDRQVGVVLDALEEAGLAESTIVVLWGDHGWHLGESGMWGKHTLLDRSLHSALVVRVPGVTHAGQRTRALAGSMDLYPTLTELCDLEGAATAHPLDGVSLVPLLEGSRAQVRSDVTAYYGKRATIRTRDYRVLATRKDGAWANVMAYDTSSPDPTPDSRVTDEAEIWGLLERLPPLVATD